MARNWAICVGVNEYDNLPNLKFAKRDAEQMQQYFKSDVKFDKIYLFTDDSPPIDDADKPYASRPTYGALRRFLRIRFEDSFLSDGDNLWFFFSGHGIRHQDRDYLLPSDADPDPAGIEDTAISISYVSERLRRSGADNVILVLDACRNEQSSKDVGIGYEKQQGVITFSSCSPAERSYEVEALGQGAFTYALLESLRIQGEGNCATVERLSQRIKYRVSEINRDHEKPKQTPYPVVEPASKYHLILLPDVATVQDIMTLKNDAFKAEIQKEWNLAKQLWMRVNVSARGTDMDAIEAFRRLALSQQKPEKNPSQVLFKSPQSKAVPVKKMFDDMQAVIRERIADTNIKNSNISDSFDNSVEKISNKDNNPKTKEPNISTIDFEFIPGHEKIIEIPELEISLPKITFNLVESLKHQKYEEADNETYKLMLLMTNRGKDEYFRVSDFKNISYEAIRILDYLWMEYTNHMFGFSTQYKIWKDCMQDANKSIHEVYFEYIKKIDYFSEVPQDFDQINKGYVLPKIKSKTVLCQELNKGMICPGKFPLSIHHIGTKSGSNSGFLNSKPRIKYFFDYWERIHETESTETSKFI